MSRVTREQWRRAWAVFRLIGWFRNGIVAAGRELEERCRLVGCDFLAFTYAAKVEYARRQTDPLLLPRHLRNIRWRYPKPRMAA